MAKEVALKAAKDAAKKKEGTDKALDDIYKTLKRLMVDVQQLEKTTKKSQTTRK
jgi:hypothetical protein